MAMHNYSSDDGHIKTFKTFPEFSKLTLADRERYEPLIKDYPPIADISFAGLCIWWDHLSTCAVSLLNDNLVISYWFPEADYLTGLSLVGTNKIDESLCTLLDYLREHDKPLRLVHVPEFVIEHIEYPEMFMCTEERDVSEYVFEVSKFYPLKQLVNYRRHRVRSFLLRNDEEQIELRSIDLSQSWNQKLLIEHDWPIKGINRIAQSFDEAWEFSIVHAEELGLDNLCLFMRGRLCAYCLYQKPADKRYVIFKHAKVDYGIPRLLDYLVYALARHFAGSGVSYVNLDSDMGVQFLRMFLLTLGPVNYFRKYAVEACKRVR
jgi:hypothetical protein